MTPDLGLVGGGQVEVRVARGRGTPQVLMKHFNSEMLITHPTDRSSGQMLQRPQRERLELGVYSIE